ncbi:MAG: threonylcarbamoyl-AMP synthase [Candidatus Aenigmatarchaeota archaeon]|nr:MAG: threonylcarbamoyl-AMP synthase [Candidatus Aenigmarchaeota archaeon]
MEILKLYDVLKKSDTRKKVLAGIRSGRIFVYPTDTIYGTGCNAEDAKAVERIRLAKGREETKMFSVIAPGKEWIRKHAKVGKVNMGLIDKLLPGPYTLILDANTKSPKPVISPEKSLGVRIPRHPFTDIVMEAGVPFVTTSVNLRGEPPVTKISDIPGSMKGFVDIAIDSGTIEGNPSRIFDLRANDVHVITRR